MKDQTVTINKEYITNLSYTDFIGLINQWNVLPGSYVTLSKWAVFSGLNSESKLLEIACTTGFSSRELVSMTGCEGKGFDLSEKSISMARYNAQEYIPGLNIEYSVADGYKYVAEKDFSHIVVGASLGFFPDPALMLEKCINMLEDGGSILASPFYAKKEIPKEIIDRSKRAFGINPTSIPYKDIMKIYNKLEIVFEEHCDLIKETEEELHYYCKCTIDRACQMLQIDDKDLYKTMYDRLYEIKSTSNVLRDYQKYSVLVLRYRKNIYPNRFVELF